MPILRCFRKGKQNMPAVCSHKHMCSGFPALRWGGGPCAHQQVKQATWMGAGRDHTRMPGASQETLTRASGSWGALTVR